MGTWGTAIMDNDTSSDIYADFFESYNSGETPQNIADNLIKKNKALIHSSEECNNFWFALALALWETKSLNEDLFHKVKTIIQSEQDLKIWEALDASQADIKKRQKVLNKFLEKISQEKSRVKPRKKKKSRTPVFEKGTCLSFKLNSGYYGGAVVLAADNSSGYGYNLIISTNINQSRQPTKTDFENAKVDKHVFKMIRNNAIVGWYLPDRFASDYSEDFTAICTIKVDKEFTVDSDEFNAFYAGDWNHIYEFMNNPDYRFPSDTELIPLTSIIHNKSWWKFW